jgi:hypothetical protein
LCFTQGKRAPKGDIKSDNHAKIEGVKVEDAIDILEQECSPLWYFLLSLTLARRKNIEINRMDLMLRQQDKTHAVNQTPLPADAQSLPHGQTAEATYVRNRQTKRLHLVEMLAMLQNERALPIRKIS